MDISPAAGFESVGMTDYYSGWLLVKTWKTTTYVGCISFIEKWMDNIINPARMRTDGLSLRTLLHLSKTGEYIEKNWDNNQRSNGAAEAASYTI